MATQRSKQLGFIICLAGWLLANWLVSVPAVLAHATAIEVAVVGEQTIELVALFDTGEPMSEAQVVVYAADNPREAWLSGVADEAGNYTFDIDPAITGQWSVSVRTAGHGEILYLNVANGGTITIERPSSRPAWLTPVLAVIVVGVLVGGGLYSSRKRKTDAHT